MKVRITSMPEVMSGGDFQLKSLFGRGWINEVRAFVKANGSFTSVDLSESDAADMLRKFQTAGAAGDFAP